ncbi:MAG TPA: carbohydrate ABC transporter substrate-binding protein [Candidatus Vogelbacteria bacterium]|nr:carbohydrate ABC transporter substrate-binding protein [Candidatus Vogelbacteria bacterium]
MKIFQIIFLIVFIFVAVVAVLIFAGILPGFRADTAKTTVPLTIWGVWPATDSNIRNLISRFNSQYEGQVSLNYVQKNINTLENDFLNELARGSAPDIIFFPDDFIIKHRNKVTAIPYQDLSIRQFRDTFLPAGEIFMDGRGTFALPILVDPLVMYYNPDYYANVGLARPPSTWPEVVNTLEFLNEIDERRNVIRSGLAMGETVNINRFKEIFLTLLFQSGTEVISRSGNEYRVVLAEATGQAYSPALATLNFFLEFSDPRRVNYSWNRSLPMDREMFLSGRLANYFGLMSDLRILRSRNPNLNIDAVVIPQRDQSLNRITFGRVYGLAVPTASRNRATAIWTAKILAYNWPVENIVIASGLVPARRNLLVADPRDPLQDVFYRSALIIKTWPDPDILSSGAILQRIVNDVNTGRARPEGAISNATEELRGLIR